MGRYLLVSFPFELSFCISIVLPLVIQRGVSSSRQALRCHTMFICNLVKLFSQNPWTPYGPGAFSFGSFFNIFFSFSRKICIAFVCSSHSYLSYFLLTTLHTYYVPLLGPKYLSKMFLLLVSQLLQSLLPLHFHLFAYKIYPRYF